MQYCRVNWLLKVTETLKTKLKFAWHLKVHSPRARSLYLCFDVKGLNELPLAEFIIYFKTELLTNQLSVRSMVYEADFGKKNNHLNLTGRSK